MPWRQKWVKSQCAILLSFLSRCCDKMPWLQQAKVGKVYSASQLKGTIIKVGKSRQREFEAAGSYCFHNQETRQWMCVAAQCLSSFTLPSTLSREWSHPQRVCLSTSIHAIKTCPEVILIYTVPHKILIPSVRLGPVKLTVLVTAFSSCKNTWRSTDKILWFCSHLDPSMVRLWVLFWSLELKYTDWFEATKFVVSSSSSNREWVNPLMESSVSPSTVEHDPCSMFYISNVMSFEKYAWQVCFNKTEIPPIWDLWHC